MKSFMNRKMKALMLVIGSFLSTSVFAAEAPVPTEASKPIAILLVTIIIALVIVIAVLASVVTNVAKLQIQRQKLSNSSKAIIVALLSITSFTAMAADPAAATDVAVATTNYGGLSSTAFWALFAVIMLCVIVIVGLVYNLKHLLKLEKNILASQEGAVGNIAEEQGSSSLNWWDKFNSFRPLKEEATIDLGHDYDGIRELDNKLPGWWLYGFYFTILVGVIYVYRFHISDAAASRSSAAQLKEEIRIAEEEQKAYLEKAGNKIDETNVVLLTDATDLDAAKKIFTTTCAACHKADGGGLVGPNLTDDYWLHGGDVKDVFKTIKYGVPEKGMQSWKDSYSPKQIQQLASYIKSIHGTNPPGAKAPQGTLYEEKGAAPAADSSKAKTDSVTKVTEKAK